MQKVLLVMTLVAASFAGGAVVNGPGLAWVKDMVGLTPPKLVPRESTESGSDLPNFDSVKPLGQEQAGVRKQTDTLELRPPEGRGLQATDPRLLAGSSAGSRVTEPQSKQALVGGSGSQSPPPLEPPGLTPVGAGIPDPPGSPQAANAALTRDSLLHRSSAPAVVASVVPGQNQGPPLPSPTPAAASPRTPQGTSTWGDVARKLKAQGVSKYWIEGEPGQAVRFRCSVPVPGHASVSQQFEAESTDVLLAAESVLRRIVLWRATEAP